MLFLLVYSLVQKIFLMTDSASSVRNAVKRFRGFLTKLPGMAGALVSTLGIFAPRNAGTRMIY
jgi:hypothetical protein